MAATGASTLKRPSDAESRPVASAGTAELSVTPAEFQILLALASETLHGYRIMQLINDVFRSDTRIGPGTLYRALQRLSAAGLIVEIVEAPGALEDERRRMYRLTERGEQAAATELQRLEGLVRLARARLAGR